MVATGETMRLYFKPLWGAENYDEDSGEYIGDEPAGAVLTVYRDPSTPREPGLRVRTLTYEAVDLVDAHYRRACKALGYLPESVYLTAAAYAAEEGASGWLDYDDDGEITNESVAFP